MGSIARILSFPWKSETERKECGGGRTSEKPKKIRRKKFEKYHVPDTPGLDPRSPRFTPRGPAGPLPVDALGCSAQAIQEGGEMRGNTFVTTRGDHISRPHGRCPPQGQIGGPYPKIDEVSEGGAHW